MMNNVSILVVYSLLENNIAEIPGSQKVLQGDPEVLPGEPRRPSGSPRFFGEFKDFCETCTNSALQNHIENQKIFQNPHKVYSLDFKRNIPYGGFEIFFDQKRKGSVTEPHGTCLWAPRFRTKPHETYL